MGSNSVVLFIYTTPILPLCVTYTISGLLEESSERQTHTHTSLTYTRIGFPLLPGLQGHKLSAYSRVHLLLGEQGLQHFEKTNSFCFHLTWVLNPEYLSYKPSALTTT